MAPLTDDVVAAPGRRSGRRPGESRTRELIAEAARRQFGERGYDRTSIRSVAAEAGVDPALVMRFYGTKQRLFVAVLDTLDPAAFLATVIEDGRQDVGTRVARFIVTALEGPVHAAAFTGLIRAAVSEPEAARLLNERLASEVLVPIAELLDMDRAHVRGALAATQTIGLVMGRYILRIEALVNLSTDEVVDLIAPTMQRYLIEPL